MKKRSLSLMLLALMAVVLAACGGGASEQAPAAESETAPAANEEIASGDSAAGGEVKEITINASNFEFDPKEVRVNVGDTVVLKMVNVSGVHGLAIPELGINITDSEPVEFTVDKAGTYKYVCSIFCGAGHADMVGELIVE
jgi:cytochrome c oxidase subunit 2